MKSFIANNLRKFQDVNLTDPRECTNIDVIHLCKISSIGSRVFIFVCISRDILFIYINKPWTNRATGIAFYVWWFRFQFINFLPVRRALCPNDDEELLKSLGGENDGLSAMLSVRQNGVALVANLTIISTCLRIMYDIKRPAFVIVQ